MIHTRAETVLAPSYLSDGAIGDGSGGFVLPTGTVTCLMTDIEGSTRAWQASAEALSVAVPRHDAILDEAIATHRGVRPVEQGEGDSVAQRLLGGRAVSRGPPPGCRRRGSRPR